MHIAPACTGSREGFDHFRSYVHNLSLHSDHYNILKVETMHRQKCNEF
jgi:hypothetical protein